MKRTLATLLWLLVPLASVAAQSPRPGIRLSLTRVEAMGGFTASGFLVVPGSRVVRTPAPECGEGAVRIDAAGRDARGRIRGAHLVVVAMPVARDAPFGAGPCDASLSIELDDGTSVVADRGTMHVQRIGANGLEADVSGSANGPTGVPTTVTGHVLLPQS